MYSVLVYRAALMRWSSLLILAAACRSNSDTPADAPHSQSDAPKQIDAPRQIDAPAVDAPPDGPAGPASRVWALGDFITNNVLVAGGFVDGAALPFGPATPPPIMLPGGTSVLATGTGISSAVLDATPDGTHTAFLADLTTAGTFDIYFAGPDGSTPALVVAGQAGVTIASLSLSPDGTKIAYTADSGAVPGGFDLYVVGTATGSTPVKVSPDRPAGAMAPPNLDVFFQVTWSADSKFLAFSGDLSVDNVSQAFVVDTTATTPTAVTLLAATDVTSPSVGVRGPLSFDPADNVYFRASTAGTAVFQLFVATSDGVTRTTYTMPARGDTSVPDAGAFAISPDGATIVFSADAPTLGNYDIYAQPLAGGAAVNLTNLTGPGNAAFTTPMWFSPDGKSLAFVANFSSARREPFVAAIDGSGMHRLVDVLASCSGCSSPDADLLQWTVDGSAIYVQGDVTANNDTKVYRVVASMTDQTPALAIDVPTNGDFVGILVRKM